MSEIITINHAEFTARQITYDAIRNANCHMTWLPEFVDLALSRFPAYTLSRLVESPAFVQGCAEIIATEYKDPEAKRRQVFVTPETLGYAGRTAHLEFMDAYTSRALQRCLKRANLSIIDNEKWEDGQSIIFVQYTVIMPKFLVGKTDGSTATAYHCASYCGRSMRSAIEPLKDLIFDGQRKDYVPDVRLQINDDGTFFDPTEADMVTNYQTTIRQISDHVTDVELRNAIDAALSRSRYPTLIRIHLIKRVLLPLKASAPSSSLVKVIATVLIVATMHHKCRALLGGKSDVRTVGFFRSLAGKNFREGIVAHYV